MTTFRTCMLDSLTASLAAGAPMCQDECAAHWCGRRSLCQFAVGSLNNPPYEFCCTATHTNPTGTTGSTVLREQYTKLGRVPCRCGPPRSPLS